MLNLDVHQGQILMLNLELHQGQILMLNLEVYEAKDVPMSVRGVNYNRNFWIT